MAHEKAIDYLIEKYPDYTIGYSDHTLNISSSIAAVALGARIIEKHITISKKDKFPDAFFSLEFNDLASSGKHLKPLLPSCFLLIHDLSRYFDAGFIQVFKESIFFKIWSVWFLKYTLSVEHLSVA